MKRFFLITMLTAALCGGIRSQVRVGIQAGPAFAGKQDDTSFFANRHFTERLKLGFHKGRLGLVVTGAMVQQSPGDVVGDGRLPNLDPPGVPQGFFRYAATGGRTNTTLFTLGPQICFPLGPVNLQLHGGGGVAISTATPITITRSRPQGQSETAYTSRIDNSTTGVVNGGAGLEYWITKRIGIHVQGDYTGYNIKYLNTDIRNTAGQQETAREQKKQLTSITGGLTYKF